MKIVIVCNSCSLTISNYFDHLLVGISKSLTAAERNRLGLRADDEHGEGRQAGLNAKEFLGRCLEMLFSQMFELVNVNISLIVFGFALYTNIPVIQ